MQFNKNENIYRKCRTQPMKLSPSPQIKDQNSTLWFNAQNNTQQYQKSKYSARNTKISPTVLWFLELSVHVCTRMSTLTSFPETTLWTWTGSITALHSPPMVSGKGQGKAASTASSNPDSWLEVESWDKMGLTQPHQATAILTSAPTQTPRQAFLLIKRLP